MTRPKINIQLPVEDKPGEFKSEDVIAPNLGDPSEGGRACAPDLFRRSQAGACSAPCPCSFRPAPRP